MQLLKYATGEEYRVLTYIIAQVYVQTKNYFGNKRTAKMAKTEHTLTKQGI